MSASPQAIAAVRAAKNRERWGDFATFRYLEKHGVPDNMWSIARWHEIGLRIKRTNRRNGHGNRP